MTYSPYDSYRHPTDKTAAFTELLTAKYGSFTASRSINVHLTIYRIISFLASIYNSNTVTFHYRTWRTIVNIRFHCVNQIKLNNLKTANSCSHIVFNKQLSLRIVYNHIIRSFFTSPHINCGLNNGLTLTGTRYCKRILY